MTSPRDVAVAAEAADTANWLDMFAAAPPTVRGGLGLQTRRAGMLAMVRSHIPFSHFNMVLTLGCPADVNDAAFAAIADFYAGPSGPATHWVLVNDHSQPPDLGAQLEARGYTPSSVWERVILDGVPADRWAAVTGPVEDVTSANAQDWSAFLMRVYGMPPPIGEWLRSLVGRAGWHHAVLREGGAAGAPVVMARSLYLAGDGWAWLGVDAPVPGVMAPCFAEDQLVTAHLLRRAAEAGAHRFVSDIEVPAPDRRGPAYERWGALGFTPAYLRRLYRWG